MENRHIKRLRAVLQEIDGRYMQAAKLIEKLTSEGWTYASIGRKVGYSGDWCASIVAWATTPDHDRQPTPFGGAERRVIRARAQTRKTLRGATSREVQQIIRSLPRPVQRNLKVVADRELSAGHLNALNYLNSASDDIRLAIAAFRPAELPDAELAEIRGLAANLREALAAFDVGCRDGHPDRRTRAARQRGLDDDRADARG